MKQPDFGAFVISLDFELHWGVRDHLSTTGEYRQNLLGEDQVVPALLDLFQEFEIAATWATVGFLFAKSKEELDGYKPSILPDYIDSSLFPYDEEIGADEESDPLHYAPRLIEQIQNTPRQEIATHTFSHYYCLEPGQTKESFAADLQSAVAIAEPYGVRPRSIVFPRNQCNSDYESVLLENGIVCFRGNQKSWMYQISATNRKHPLYRAARLADSYFNVAGTHTFKWQDVWSGNIANVPASMFLRPISKKMERLEKLRLQRIRRSIAFAAKKRRIFHLWWHPHNFGVNLEENLDFLREILKTFRRYQQSHNLCSLSMLDVARAARDSAC
ncbi:MAG: polysaccharide deacetylase family protein [Pyrinomonadaceae bacterium]